MTGLTNFDKAIIVAALSSKRREHEMQGEEAKVYEIDDVIGKLNERPEPQTEVPQLSKPGGANEPWFIALTSKNAGMPVVVNLNEVSCFLPGHGTSEVLVQLRDGASILVKDDPLSVLNLLNEVLS